MESIVYFKRNNVKYSIRSNYTFFGSFMASLPKKFTKNGKPRAKLSNAIALIPPKRKLIRTKIFQKTHDLLFKFRPFIPSRNTFCTIYSSLVSIAKMVIDNWNTCRGVNRILRCVGMRIRTLFTQSAYSRWQKQKSRDPKSECRNHNRSESFPTKVERSADALDQAKLFTTSPEEVPIWKPYFCYWIWPWKPPSFILKVSWGIFAPISFILSTPLVKDKQTFSSLRWSLGGVLSICWSILCYFSELVYWE